MKYKYLIFTLLRDNGQELVSPTSLGTSEIWLKLPETNFLVSTSSDGSVPEIEVKEFILSVGSWPRLCENAMVGIIRRSLHRGKLNEAFH